MPPGQFVVLTGGIAVGKTTVTLALGERLPGVTVLPEDRGDYVDDFYRDPERFAYENQLGYTLVFVRRAEQVSEMSVEAVVQERSIHDTHRVFSALLRSKGFLTESQFEYLSSLHRKAARRLRPTLLILLDAEVHTSHERLLRRDHPADASISLEYSLEYLEALREQHLRWFSRYRLSPRVCISTEGRAVDDVVGELASLVGGAPRVFG
jgi:deoxyadenosine/deoxycytidine kinase